VADRRRPDPSKLSPLVPISAVFPDSGVSLSASVPQRAARQAVDADYLLEAGSDK